MIATSRKRKRQADEVGVEYEEPIVKRPRSASTFASVWNTVKTGISTVITTAQWAFTAPTARLDDFPTRVATSVMEPSVQIIEEKRSDTTTPPPMIDWRATRRTTPTRPQLPASPLNTLSDRRGVAQSFVSPRKEKTPQLSELVTSLHNLSMCDIMTKNGEQYAVQEHLLRTNPDVYRALEQQRSPDRFTPVAHQSQIAPEVTRSWRHTTDNNSPLRAITPRPLHTLAPRPRPRTNSTPSANSTPRGNHLALSTYSPGSIHRRTTTDQQFIEPDVPRRATDVEVLRSPYINRNSAPLQTALLEPPSFDDRSVGMSFASDYSESVFSADDVSIVSSDMDKQRSTRRDSLIDLTMDNDSMWAANPPNSDVVSQELRSYNQDLATRGSSTPEKHDKPQEPMTESMRQLNLIRDLAAKYKDSEIEINRQILEQIARTEQLEAEGRELREGLKKNQDRRLNELRDARKKASDIRKGFKETGVPVREMSAEQTKEISDIFKKGQMTVIIDKFNIDIKVKDLKTLYDRSGWLNDEVINFYMKLLHEREIKFPKETLRCHYYNTFFYKILKDRGYKGVRRWSKKAKIDIFELDKVVVPVHLGSHWCLSVINFKEKKFEYYDSLGSPNPKCLEKLRGYVTSEYEKYKGGEYDLSDWTDDMPDKIPHQHNGYDCGVFLCRFAECVGRGARFDFSQKDMAYFRHRMIMDIKTGEIKDLVQ